MEVPLHKTLEPYQLKRDSASRIEIPSNHLTIAIYSLPIPKQWTSEINKYNGFIKTQSIAKFRFVLSTSTNNEDMSMPKQFNGNEKYK